MQVTRSRPVHDPESARDLANALNEIRFHIKRLDQKIGPVQEGFAATLMAVVTPLGRTLGRMEITDAAIEPSDAVDKLTHQWGVLQRVVKTHPTPIPPPLNESAWRVFESLTHFLQLAETGSRASCEPIVQPSGESNRKITIEEFRAQSERDALAIQDRIDAEKEAESRPVARDDAARRRGGSAATPTRYLSSQEFAQDHGLVKKGKRAFQSRVDRWRDKHCEDDRLREVQNRMHGEAQYLYAESVLLKLLNPPNR